MEEECEQLVQQRDFVRMEPIGIRFVTGIASSYDDDFPPELDGVLEPEEFMLVMNRINKSLSDYWPCCLCFSFGFVHPISK